MFLATSCPLWLLWTAQSSTDCCPTWFARQACRSPANCGPGGLESVPTTECAVDLLPAMLLCCKVSKPCRGLLPTVFQLWHGLNTRATVRSSCRGGTETCCSSVHDHRAHQTAPVQLRCMVIHAQAAYAVPWFVDAAVSAGLGHMLFDGYTPSRDGLCRVAAAVAIITDRISISLADAACIERPEDCCHDLARPSTRRCSTGRHVPARQCPGQAAIQSCWHPLP